MIKFGAKPLEEEKVIQDESQKVKKISGMSESDVLIKAFKKEKGEMTVIKGNQIPKVDRIPSGVFEFDLATKGGWPRARLGIIYGPEGSTKTSLMYKTMASAQKLPAPCNKVVYVDLEGTTDPSFISKFGIDLEELIIIKPSYGEEAADMIDALVQADDVALIVVDSIAVMSTVKEADKSMETADMGTSSMLIKRLCNKIAWAFGKGFKRGHFPTVIFVNQTRFKLGVMFGDPETMPGGNTMKFMSSLTVRLYGKGKVDKTYHPAKPVLREVNAVIKKAKVGVSAVAFEYDFCVHPYKQLQVGDTDSWKPVLNHLRSVGVIRKPDKGTGWEFEGVVYPTLDQIESMYWSDETLKAKLQKIVVDAMSNTEFLVEASDAAK